MARKKSLIKDLSACETVIMKVIWDAVDDIALQQLIVDLFVLHNHLSPLFLFII